MAESSIKLLGTWSSPFVIRTRITLNLKLVDYEFVQENLGAKSELLLKSNPVYKKVPVFLHGDKVICESLNIVQYIDDVWSYGLAILPIDPYERALARFWATYLEDKWHPLTLVIIKSKNVEEMKAAVDQVTDGLLLIEDVYKKCSKGKTFFGGDHIGYLDIVLGAYLGWIKASESLNGVKIFDEAKTPCLAEWVDAFMDDAAVKVVMPEASKMEEYAKVVFARVKAAAGQ